MTRYFNRS
jgi:hypothetical protein